MLAIIPIPAFTDNYIWLLREGDNAVVVDPGDAAPVRAFLAREGLRLTAILNTHHHRDHVGGNTALLEHADVPVFGPAREAIPGCTRHLREHDRFMVPGLDLEMRVLDVPGHTAGHIAFVADAADTMDAIVDAIMDARAADPIAFVGDTLFAGGCGRLFEGTAIQMADSLRKLASLPAATRVYCAHEYTLANLRFAAAVEPANAALHMRTARAQQQRAQGEPTVPSILADERATNPFLRTAEAAVVAAAAAHAGRAITDSVDAFAVLRAWKDRF